MRRKLSLYPYSKLNSSHFFQGEFQRFKVERLERVEYFRDKKTGKEKPREIFRLDVAPILSKIGEGRSLFSPSNFLVENGQS